MRARMRPIWLIILIASVTSSHGTTLEDELKELGERITALEKECQQLQKLTSKSDIYPPLSSACDETLNQHKYLYVDKATVDMKKYEQDETFSVTCNHGEEKVKKPPPLSSDEVKSKIQNFDVKKPMSEEDKLGQQVVDKEVECGLAEASAADRCFSELNCLKDSFMNQKGLKLQDHAVNFVIKYKGKDVNINSPPSSARECSDANKTSLKGKKVEDKSVDDDEDYKELEQLENGKYDIRKVDPNAPPRFVTKGAVGDAMAKGAGSIAAAALINGVASTVGKPPDGRLNRFIAGTSSDVGGIVVTAVKQNTRPLTPFQLEIGHFTSLIKLITNRIRAKKNRIKLDRDQLKEAIELLTKTMIRFAIIKAKMKGWAKLDKHNKPTYTDLFRDTLEVAILDETSTRIVNYILTGLLSEDEFMTDEEAQERRIAIQNKRRKLFGFLGKMKKKDPAEKNSQEEKKS